LDGAFDIELVDAGCRSGDGRERQDPPPNLPAPPIYTALQEQLGLRLETVRGPVEMLVIEALQRPSVD
jgi:uncharacterized protein (TIGR03435 family)